MKNQPIEYGFFKVFEFDGIKYLMASRAFKAGHRMFVWIKDSLEEVEKYGASKTLGDTVVVQIIVNGINIVHFKKDIMSLQCPLTTDVPVGTLINAAHISYTKYDETGKRTAMISAKFLNLYLNIN